MTENMMAKCRVAVLYFLWCIPLQLYADELFLPEMDIKFLLLLPLFGVLIALLASFLPKRARFIAYLFLMISAVFASVFYLCHLHTHWSGYIVLLPPVIFSAAAFLNLSKPSGAEMDPSFGLWGIIVYLIGFFCTYAERFTSLREVISPMAAAYLFVLLFEYNAHSMQDGAGRSRSPSREIKRRNRVAVAVICGIALAVGNYRRLSDAVVIVFREIAKFFLNVFLWLGKLLPSVSSAPDVSGAGMDMTDMLPQTQQEQSALMHVLEKILTYFVAVILVLLALFVVYLSGRILLRAFARLCAGLRRYREDVSGDYEDHVKGLFDWQEVKTKAQKKLGRLKKERILPWNRLNNKEKIRRCYSLLSQKKQTETKTADEFLPSLYDDQSGTGLEMAEIYNAARYSSHEISKQDAALMQAQTEKITNARMN